MVHMNFLKLCMRWELAYLKKLQCMMTTILRAHIIQTISTPSECLLRELQILEDMKQQCDEKRDMYKLMLTAPRAKGRSRNAKGLSITAQQLQIAQEQYEEEANLFVFSPEIIEAGSIKKPSHTGCSTPCCTVLANLRMMTAIIMLEQVDNKTWDVSFLETLKDKGFTDQEVFYFNQRSTSLSSQSAPISALNKFDFSKKVKEESPPSKKFHTYVLPTPLDEEPYFKLY
ncbi:hypothetical protein HPP92_021685 [Vanilla planifolia]|uniref:Uncharacterized protein n=1 Tax=Vanilla planifolia TaxID=51239 RepID=A0A835Q2H4_VANPL|nr:hypothetical protein HPP92_021685 [Vanilla planifolia]